MSSTFPRKISADFLQYSGERPEMIPTDFGGQRRQKQQKKMKFMNQKNIQFKRPTRLLIIVSSLLCALLLPFAALTARAQTAAVIDPQGDAFYTNGHEAPAFLDVIAVSFTISNTLTFTVDVAGSLDALRNPPGSQGIFDWHFALNTDNSTRPLGLPLPPGQPAGAEFFVGAFWDGNSFSGIFYDRRPTLTGGDTLQYSIPVSVSGSRIILTVPETLAAEVRAAVLPGATWTCITASVTQGYGSKAGAKFADFVPDDGDYPWPQ